MSEPRRVLALPAAPEAGFVSISFPLGVCFELFFSVKLGVSLGQPHTLADGILEYV